MMFIANKRLRYKKKALKGTSGVFLDDALAKAQKMSEKRVFIVYSPEKSFS